MDRLPTRSLMLIRWHQRTAQAALLAALGWTALRPEGLVSSPFHPDTLACVHLVTIGCLATAAVGGWHAFGALILGAPLPVRAVDWFLLAALPLTAAGVASHMALGTYSGVLWSAGIAVVALLLQMWRWLPGLRHGTAPLLLRLGAGLAWGNLLLACCLGAVIALDRDRAFLPAGHFIALAGHGHLGLVGFAGTLSAVIALRLLPTLLPATPIRGPLPWLAVLGLGLGGLLMGAVLPFAADGFAVAWLAVAGGAAFLCCWLLMLAGPRPPSPARDIAAPLLFCSWAAFTGAWLCAVLALLGRLGGPAMLCTYGVLLLLGGFGSLLLGLRQRLLPAAMPSRQRTRLTLAGWFSGLPVLVLATANGAQGGVRVGALFMAVAVAADLLGTGPMSAAGLGTETAGYR
jgi:hypothetical protein